MESGGRLEMYKLMGMQPPITPIREKIKAAPLVIDRTGEQDKGRYTGLKMGLLADDDMLGQALQQASQKAKDGERLRTKIAEEDYEQPFAGTYAYPQQPNKTKRNEPTVEWLEHIIFRSKNISFLFLFHIP